MKYFPCRTTGWRVRYLLEDGNRTRLSAVHAKVPALRYFESHPREAVAWSALPRHGASSVLRSSCCAEGRVVAVVTALFKPHAGTVQYGFKAS